MNIIKTLHTNIRAIFIGIAATFICAFMADAIERWTLTESGVTWLNNTVMLFRGFARLGIANLGGLLFIAVGWPTVNKFGNDSFKKAWDNLPEWGQFATLVAVALTYLIAACICFTA